MGEIQTLFIALCIAIWMATQALSYWLGTLLYQTNVRKSIKGGFMTKIEKRRKEQGLSRQRLADKVGITYEAIMHYEHGDREPKASILKKIATVLKCRMEDLI